MALKFNPLQTILFITFTSSVLLAQSTPHAGQNIESFKMTISEIGVNNCDAYLKAFKTGLSQSFNKRLYSKEDARYLINTSAQKRLLLRNTALGLTQSCDLLLKDIFVLQRDQETYWSLASHLHSQVKGSDTDFTSMPVPLKTTASMFEKYITEAGPQSDAINFNNGDLMIARGISWTSSIISQATSNKNHFSHGIIVYKTNKGKEYTIESYIGSGVKIYNMDFALKNENARLQVYRYKHDKQIAEKAANYAYQNYVYNRHVDYDYNSNFNSDRSLTCIEIPYWSYKIASQSNVILPQYPSQMTATSRNLLSSLGLKNGDFFGPSDMEIDPRFDLVADWTDHRFLKDNFLKDIVSTKLIEWTTKLNYIYDETFSSFILKSRMVKKLLELIRLVPKGLPRNYAQAAAKMTAVSEKMYKIVETKYNEQMENAELKKPGSHPPTKDELLAFLEFVRREDLKRYKNGDKILVIHDVLTPPQDI